MSRNCSTLRRVGPLGVFTILLLRAVSLAVQDPPRHVERVDVARVLMDARVVDHRGQPVLGLTTENFQVRIDGKPARVESVQWVAGALAATEAVDRQPSPDNVRRMSAAVEGRLVVFLFQKSLERGRIVGFMRMLLDLRTFLDGFTPHDRIAVLSFDSRLRLWLDFTADMNRVRDVLARNVLFEGSPPTRSEESPSLFDRLDADRADRTYNIESALRLLALALKPLPGAKSVVLVGHGFGRLSTGGVMMENNYDEARAALQDARASVFCLDVTYADYHSLEAGLQIVAEDTGGFFERTHIFGQRALTRLGAALAGHYVLMVEKPIGRSGQHGIDVRLKGRSGTVLARNTFID
jgi:VWFA-related protein